MSLPITVVNDFYLEVTKGNIAGFVAKDLLGMNAAVGGTEDVWNQGGSITQVSTAALLYVSSTAAADAALAVVITGLDANYDEITETILTATPDGQIRAAGTKAFLRVNSVTMAVAPAGKVYVYYATAAGVGTGIPADATKIQAAVDIAGTQAYNAIYTVPRNKTWYMTGLRYRSTGSVATHNVILSVIRKIYGGSNETVKTVKYVDLATTLYTDEQIQFVDQPVIFPAKSDIRIAAGLSGGTALDIAIEVNFVEESVEVTPSVVTVMNKAEYLAYLALGPTLASQNYWLIGLDELPATLPTTANLDDVVATITGLSTGYTVAADTEVAFDIAYFSSGKLAVTDKKAILTIMRCIDNGGVVKYVLAPVNTLFSLGGVKKVSYLKV